MQILSKFLRYVCFQIKIIQHSITLRSTACSGTKPSSFSLFCSSSTFLLLCLLPCSYHLGDRYQNSLNWILLPIVSLAALSHSFSTSSTLAQCWCYPPHKSHLDQELDWRWVFLPLLVSTCINIISHININYLLVICFVSQLLADWAWDC